MYRECEMSPRSWARGVVKGSCSRPLGLEENGNGGEKDRETRRMSEPTVPQNFVVYQGAISVRY
jgi:hypothetical protein